MDFWFKVAYVVLIAAGASMWAVFRRWRAQSWPETFGRVEQYVIVKPTGGSHENARHGISYSYRVDGEYYAGEVAIASVYGFPRTEEDVVRLYPRGSEVRVKYKPGHPDVSVFVPNEVPHSSVYFPPRDDPR